MNNKKVIKLIMFVMIFIIAIPNNVYAAKDTNCISEFNVKGSTRRWQGHQGQWFNNGSYTVKGSVNDSSCFSFSSSDIVQVKASGGSFQFTALKGGVSTVNVTLSASCSCTGSASSKSITFNFSEWGLHALEVKGYSLSPEFYNMVMEYSINVPIGIDKVTLVVTPNESNAKITVNGIATSSGEISANIVDNKIKINVTTSTGDSRLTTITVNRTENNSQLNPASSSSKGSEEKPSTQTTSQSSKDVVQSTTTEKENPQTGEIHYILVCILSVILLVAIVYQYIKNFAPKK